MHTIYVGAHKYNKHVFMFLSRSVRKVQFPVKVCHTAIQLHMRGKPKRVTVVDKPGQTIADFKKSRDGFILLVPPN